MIRSREPRRFQSFSFDPVGPALILPAGFTANAPGVIADNRWIDPRPTAVPVPVPLSAPLLALALGAFGLFRRRGRADAGP